ncbi:MAG: hypothetical protein HC930_04095 [Hydrococcus sp. SU_1_0]|nr:hypothetical protein [Hydrococcus sp. SU_1_0]
MAKYQATQASENAIKKFKEMEIEALEDALETGKNLAEMTNKNSPPGFSKGLPTEPLFALQTILSQIHEKNRIIHPKPKHFTAVSFSPDGNEIATGGEDEILRFWKKSGKLIYKRDTDQKISTLSFSPSGDQVVTGGKNGSVKLWNSSNLQFLEELKCHSKGAVRSLEFDRDANYLFTGGSDGNVCLWNLKELNSSKNLI